MKKFLVIKEKGVTLIETLIYVSIFIVFSLTLSSFTTSIQGSRQKNQINSEIHYQGSSATRLITFSIRNALNVNSPAISISANELNLEMSDPLKNPTLFYMATGTLYIKEGADDPIPLTNTKVKVSDLIFSNYARPDTADSVQLRFKLSNPDENQDPEQQYSVDFYGGASIRQ